MYLILVIFHFIKCKKGIDQILIKKEINQEL